MPGVTDQSRAAAATAREPVRQVPARSQTSVLGGLLSFRAGLAAVLVLAAVLRLWSIDFGVPLVTHPDEPNILAPAQAMVDQRDINPRWFVYPGLLIYLEAAVVVAVRAVGLVVDLTPDQITSAQYVGGRLLVVLFSVATVGLVGLLGRRLAPRRGELVGVLAAGVLAVSFLHVKDSHFLKPDVPTAFFTALTLWFTLDALEGDRRRSWGLAAASVGLAAAMKYTGVLVGLVPAVAFPLRYPVPRAWLRQWRTAALLVFLPGLVFVALNPGMVLTPRTFYQDAIVYNRDHYRTGHEGAEGNDTWRWYLGEIRRTGVGTTLTPLLIVGVAVEAARSLRRDRAALLLLLFPLVYYLDSSRYVVRFDRQLIPILPFLALMAARWLSFVPMPMPSPVLLPDALRAPGRVRWLKGALALIVVALLAVPAVAAAAWNIDAGRTDTRYLARDWIRAHVPPGTTIAREWHTPPFEPDGYRDLWIRAVYEQEIAWFESEGVEYLVISSFMYQRYLDEPDRYPHQAAFYTDLLAQPAAATFRPEGDYTGPVIVILRYQDATPAFLTRRWP